MSEAAKKLVEQLRDEVGFDATTFEKHAAYEIDKAVAPLVSACEEMAARLRLDTTTSRAWVDDQVKALEGWKQ